jgi:regulator of nucleoside diphosphate kinase
MLHHPPTETLPSIVISEADEHRLTALATAAALTGDSGSVAQALLAEMERAQVVRDSELPAGTVRMHSTVEFEIDGKERRRVAIVYPGEANIDAGKVSVLTPIGTALIGLSAGQTMTTRGPDGRTHELRVLTVVPSFEKA